MSDVAAPDAAPDADPGHVADALMASLAILARRIRQVRPTPDLSHPESIALSSLERHGPSTSAELARLENVRAQSMHATVAGLTRRGLVERRPDPADGRRVVVSVTDAGRALTRDKQRARSSQLLTTLTTDFTAEERAVMLAAAPLLGRLGTSL